MAELRPIPIEHLLRRLLEEPRAQQSLFDLPLRKCWRPDPKGDVDLSVAVHGRRAETPVGPAAGPHAQLAQNVLLAWLGGARIIELKTVQILDELKIARPCIDAATVGLNVEWSQELRLDESLREYVTAWLLLAVARALDPLGIGERACAASSPVFELSVGYDLKGLQSPRMRAYLEAVKDVGKLVDDLRPRVRAATGSDRLADVEVDPRMVSCVTLSTFHGCPPGEIEKIALYLLGEIGVDVIVKFNPTLLGFEEVTHVLRERMGYRDLSPREAAFATDLEWQDALALGHRLESYANKHGRHFGVKMTNTLVVENHKKFFPASEKDMYLSGPPLHVLALRCADRWRAAFGTSVPLSFSGGIDQHNAADAVACDLVPVTTCTDLLRPGGYGRLPRYLDNLTTAMRDVGARDREELILRRFGHGPEAVRVACASLREEGERLSALDGRSRQSAEALFAEAEVVAVEAVKGRTSTLAAALEHFAKSRLSGKDAAATLVRANLSALRESIVSAAGALNTHELSERALGDPRYAAGKNSKPPRKVGTALVLLDCLSCDKCVPVCPNDANFMIATPLEEIACEDLLLDGDGKISRAPAALFRFGKPEQWANFADACNECGNCDVFCPEDGGPYIMKARWFGSQASMDASPALDGLHVTAGDGIRVSARVGGVALALLVAPSGEAILEDGRVRARYDAVNGNLLDATPIGDARGPHTLRGSLFLTLRALCRGALDPARVNPVSAALPGVRWPS